MADNTGRAIKDTYKDLLQVANNNAGLDATLRAVSSGAGTDSALLLSTTSVKVNGTFYIGNFTLELDANLSISSAGCDFLNTPSSANLKALVSDETGSGALVFADSPTLTSPDLGTPSSGDLSNCTNYPVALSDITGLGTGIEDFLATPSSANLLAAITDETGTGAVVFANSPTLVTPDLGVATATTINKVTITAPTNGSTLTIDDGKTLTVQETLTTPSVSSTAGQHIRTTSSANTLGYSSAVHFENMVVLTNGTTSWSVPADVNRIYIELWGAGGGGGGNSAGGGSGGGSGAYCAYLGAVTPGGTITTSIPAGASGGASGGANSGSSGGSCTATGGGLAATLTAPGGTGGAGNTGNGVPGIGAGASIATNGTLNMPGTGGSSGMTTANGTIGGKGGDAPRGGGGGADVNGTTAGNTGNTPGGGGGGASGNAAGGTGGAARIVIWY